MTCFHCGLVGSELKDEASVGPADSTIDGTRSDYCSGSGGWIVDRCFHQLR